MSVGLGENRQKHETGKTGKTLYRQNGKSENKLLNTWFEENPKLMGVTEVTFCPMITPWAAMAHF